MSPCRVVLLCFVYICVVCCVDETAYHGQSVLLRSGAEQSWNLTKAQWYIYKNTTYIASLKDGRVIIYKFWRYRGRLELDNITGDLIIHNVTMDDSMIYNVDLVSSDNTRKHVKVHLTVQERLHKPVVQKVMRSLQGGRCHAALSCSAFDQNATLSWRPDGDFNGSYISGIPNSVGSLSVLYLSFSGNTNATFNCSASSGQQMETGQMTVGCSDVSEKREDAAICSSCVSSVIWSLLLGFAMVLALACAFKRKEKIKEFGTNDLPNFIRRLR